MEANKSVSGWNAQRLEPAGELRFITLRHLRYAPRFQSGEIKLARVGQVLGLDVAQGRKDGLRASRNLTLPVGQHLLDGDPLHVVLRPTQLAGNDGELAAARVALDVALGNIGQRPNDDVTAVFGQKLRRHRLQPATE